MGENRENAYDEKVVALIEVKVDALYKAMKERENEINPSDFFSDQYK